MTLNVNGGWESYLRCDSTLVPADTRWDECEFAPNGWRVFYGGPSQARGVWRWGAPFRRIQTEDGERVIYARFIKEESNATIDD